MPISHIFLAILVAAIWGFNFIFIKFSLVAISPLLLCAIRFFLASIPAVFFIKPPKAPFKWVIIYGLLMFGLQFSLMFMGMKAGMPPGLASLLIQVQIFFSIFFAALFLDERPGLAQLIGALVAFSGIALVAMHFDNEVTLTGFLFIIAASATWGLGNLVTKKISQVNMISLVVWGSFVACFPLIILSLLFEGVASIEYMYNHITGLEVISVLYIVYLSTWIGYGAWSKLVSQYPVATVVPFTLLVPIFGMIGAMIFLGEPLQYWKLLAGILVITGLVINLMGARFSIKNIDRFKN